MKKIIALLLASVFAFSLVACSNTASSSTTDSKLETSSSTKEPIKETPAADTTPEVESDTESNEELPTGLSLFDTETFCNVYSNMLTVLSVALDYNIVPTFTEEDGITKIDHSINGKSSSIIIHAPSSTDTCAALMCMDIQEAKSALLCSAILIQMFTPYKDGITEAIKTVNNLIQDIASTQEAQSIVIDDIKYSATFISYDGCEAYIFSVVPS